MSSGIMTPATQTQPPSESIFARSLKKYEDITFEKNKTCRAVVAFDEDLFHRTCSKISDDYDEKKCNFDEITDEIFQEGESWISRDLISHVLDLIAARHGWVKAKNRTSFTCNRYGEGRSARDFTAGQLKVNCTFIIRLSPLVNIGYFPESQKDSDRKKKSYKPDWDQPVHIIKGTCTSHSGDCNPSRQNRVAAMSRGGSYVQNTPHKALYSLCNIAENFGKLTSATIKNVMRPVWPSQKVITKQNIFYIRAKVMKLMPVFRKSNLDYDEFKKVVNCDDFLKGVDNEELDDDEAYQLAQSLWLEVLDTNEKKEDAIMSFIEYLELIKCRAKGFTYKLAEDTSGDGKKLIGVVWMTATMRRNFELFGGYISLDMMKRGLNTLLWPYCAVTMYDEHMKICVACEGILCGERHDTYKFIAQFLSESAPGRPLEEVSIVAGDGFFDQETIAEFGFVNARFITDRWHLLDSGLCKMFGDRAYGLLQGHLKRMVEATTEKDFEDILCLAKELLGAQPQRDMQMEKDLEDFASCRHSFADYLIAQIPGNLHRRGSSISESNHSSTIAHLNDGNKQGNNFCEHPIILIRELLTRQRKHSAEMNQILFGDGHKMRFVLANLEQQPLTAATQDLKKAALVLNLPTYERYQSANESTHLFRVNNQYVADQASPSLQLCTAVHSTLSNEPPRIFPNEMSRCDCSEQPVCEACGQNII